MLIHPQFDPVAIHLGPLAIRWYGLMYLVGFILFLLVGRLRPPPRAVHALVSETRPDSFPSGHAALAFALALAVFLVLAHTVRQRWAAGAAGVLFTAAVGLSRVYLGVHYPTDVIGSVLVGTAAMLVWLPVWNRAAGPRLAQALERRQGRPQPGPAGEGGRR